MARDHEGRLIAAVSNCQQGRMAPEIAQAIGLREVLSWIKGQPWVVVTVETDCLVLVQAVKSSIKMESYFGGIVNYCKTLLAEMSQMSLIFVKRSANRVAHYLARVCLF